MEMHGCPIDGLWWLRWELRGLLAGQRLSPEAPLSAAGIERWQLELAVQRLLLRWPPEHISLPPDALLSPGLSLQEVLDQLRPRAPQTTDALAPSPPPSSISTPDGEARAQHG